MDIRTDKRSIVTRFGERLNVTAETINQRLEFPLTGHQPRGGDEGFRLLFEQSPLGYLVIDENGRIRAANPAWSELSGYSAEETEGRHFKDFLLPDEIRVFEKGLARMLKAGRVKDLEIAVQPKKGRTLTLNLSGRKADPPEIFPAQLCFCILQDITEQKQRREALIETERRFRESLGTIEMAAVMLDVDGRITYANDYTAALVGLLPGQLEGKNWFESFIPAENRWKIFHTFANGLNDGDFPSGDEYEIQTASGERRAMRWKTTRLYDPAGGVSGTASVGEDVTERLSSELQLRSRQASMLSIIESTEDPIWAVDRDYRLTIGNAAYQQQIEATLGRRLQPGEPVFGQEADPAGSSEWRGYYDRALAGEKFSLELPPLDQTPPRLMEYWFNPILDEQAQIVGVSITARDVTTRRMIADALREMNDRLFSTLESINDGFFTLDNQLVIKYFNHAAGSLLNRRVEDVIDRYVFDAFPELEGSIFEDYFVQAVIERASSAFETYFDGEPYANWYDVRVYPHDSGMSVFFDVVSERKRAEEQLHNAILEKEILLRELYHRTKNNLQVVSAMLDLQTGMIADAEARTLLLETQNKIHAMSLVHQMLYRSQSLASLDLRDYISDLVKLLADSYQVDRKRISVRLDLESLPVNIDSAIPCGLVLTELVSNAFKHAFPGEKEGEITISLHREQRGQIVLAVSDNGAGVPPDFDFRTQRSLGLRTIFALVENQLQGEVAFRGGQGTACEIRFDEAHHHERI